MRYLKTYEASKEQTFLDWLKIHSTISSTYIINPKNFVNSTIINCSDGVQKNIIYD